MGKYILPVLVLLALLLALFWLFARRRAARQLREEQGNASGGNAEAGAFGWLESQVSSEKDPLVIDAADSGVTGTYISTVRGENLHQKVLAFGLGNPAPSRLRFERTHLRICRANERDLFIRWSQIAEIGRGPGLAGKYPGGHRVTLIKWHRPVSHHEQTNEPALVTGLLLDDAEDTQILQRNLQQFLAQKSQYFESVAEA